jgi:hypothetical protein
MPVVEKTDAYKNFQQENKCTAGGANTATPQLDKVNTLLKQYIEEKIKAVSESQNTSNVENILNDFLNTNTNTNTKNQEKDKVKNTVKRESKVDIKALGIPRMDSSLREQFRALALIDLMKRLNIKIE